MLGDQKLSQKCCDNSGKVKSDLKQKLQTSLDQKFSASLQTIFRNQ